MPPPAVLPTKPGPEPGVGPGALGRVWCWLLGARASPAAGQTVRIAFIDPLSGPAADIGRNSLRSWQFMAEHKVGARARRACRFVVAGFDNKASPQESVNAQGGHRPGLSLHRARQRLGGGGGPEQRHHPAQPAHPDRAVLFINYAAMDPALTNERCNFWHFRIDADTAMKMRAMTGFMASQPDLRKVYLLNQNYAHGQQFSRYFREEVAPAAPTCRWWAMNCTRPFQGIDFKPYVRASRPGAQALVTGNWGADMRDLVQGAAGAGRAHLPFALLPRRSRARRGCWRETGDRMPVYQVAYNHSNQEGPMADLAVAFRQRHGEDLVVYAAYDGMVMLSQAMATWLHRPAGWRGA
jgi:branched-chain amino acid transport system substrate-binding protein